MSGDTTMTKAGTLYLVPTPVGNLGDMTFRACDVLKSVDAVACEDTRTSARLFAEYGIDTLRTSFHEHNEKRKSRQLVSELLHGKNIALITDAGTPGISDPGFVLVRDSLEAGIRVESLPGATAFVPALVASGLPADRFVFEGFLPPKKGRQKRLAGLADEDRTVIFYESPHRLAKTLAQLAGVFGGSRPAVVCRELTKKFETYHRGTIDDLIEWSSAQDRIRGEIVIVLAGKRYADRVATKAADSLTGTESKPSRSRS